MKSNSNIPDRLRQMPYSVPDGYFDSLSETVLKRIPARRPAILRFAPYAAVAAAVLLAAVLFTRPSGLAEELADDSFAFADIIPQTDPDAIWYSQASEEELSEEDIINYLLFTGVGAETLEATYYENQQ